MLPRSIQSWGVLKQAHSGSIATENSPSAQQPETVLEDGTELRHSSQNQQAPMGVGGSKNTPLLTLGQTGGDVTVCFTGRRSSQTHLKHQHSFGSAGPIFTERLVSTPALSHKIRASNISSLVLDGGIRKQRYFQSSRVPEEPADLMKT